MTSPLPPSDSPSWETGDDATPGRTHLWTPEEIEAAGCTLLSLADIYERCDTAKQFALEDVAIRLCVKWGTSEIPLKSELLRVGVTLDEIAETWGCSPPDAEVPNKRCYIAQLVGKNPRTGGFKKTISRGAPFVIPMDDAPVHEWLVDEASARHVKPDFRAYLGERRRLEGKHHGTGMPWADYLAQHGADGDNYFPGSDDPSGDAGGFDAPPPAPRVSHASPPPYGAYPGAPQGYPGAPLPYGAPQGYPGAPPPYGAPQGYPGAPPPYGAPQGYPGARAPATASLQGMPGAAPAEPPPPTERERELAAQMEALKLEARLAREAAERERAERERDRKEREEKEEKERLAREKREALEREDKRHAEVLAAQATSAAQVAQLIDKQGEMFARALTSLGTKSEARSFDLPAVVTALGTGLVTPMMTMYSSKAEAESKRLEREHKERIAEINARNTIAAHAQKSDPQTAALLSTVESLKEAIKEMRKAPKDERAKEDFIDHLRKYREMRKILGLPEEGIGAAVKEAEDDPTLAIVDKVAERLEGPLTMMGSYITRRMERSDEEARTKQRKGGWVQNGVNFVQAMRARLPSGAEIEVPDDCALLANGQMCPIAMLPQVMAQAASVAAPPQAQPAPQFPGYQPAPQFPGYQPAPQFIAPVAPMPFAPSPDAQMPQAVPAWAPPLPLAPPQPELPFAQPVPISVQPEQTAESHPVAVAVAPVSASGVVPIPGEGAPAPDVSEGDGSDGDDSVAPFNPASIGIAPVQSLPLPDAPTSP